MKKKSRRAGQATVEYIFLLLIVTLGFVFFYRAIGSALDVAIVTFGGELEKNLMTGREPPYVFEN